MYGSSRSEFVPNPGVCVRDRFRNRVRCPFQVVRQDRHWCPQFVGDVHGEVGQPCESGLRTVGHLIEGYDQGIEFESLSKFRSLFGYAAPVWLHGYAATPWQCAKTRKQIEVHG